MLTQSATVPTATKSKQSVNFGELCKRYESYRAVCKKGKEVAKVEKGCIMPLDDKAQSYKIANKTN